MVSRILDALNKFELNLSGITVLTEAATGNYAVTPIIAARAGARVYAYTRDSHYGAVKEVKRQTGALGNRLGVEHSVDLVENLKTIDLKQINILTNTGFLRPVDGNLIDKLSEQCVIPLMMEPWEYRESDVDIKACMQKGIKVYGTNEYDHRLNTFAYIGFIALYFLLHHQYSPFSSNVLVVGSEHFTKPIEKVLINNHYSCRIINEYHESVNPADYNVIICAEHEKPVCLIGNSADCYIQADQIKQETFVLHISGMVDFGGLKSFFVPRQPAPFGYMSFTADYIDPKAVIDLHTAGLKVAEGMLVANRKKLGKEEYKTFMETNYPALAFDEPVYW